MKHTDSNSPDFPMRINRFLALKGYATRREADDLIAKGKVFINGTPASIGAKVQATDAVTVRTGVHKKAPTYLAYYKPRGVITHSPQKGEKSIADIAGNKDIFPVGRLDKDSEGLIILTDDGRITERLLSPDAAHEKEYHVYVDKSLTQSALEKMARGVRIEGYFTKKARVKKIADKECAITLTEGKKHQIRRMCAALGYQVRSLKRTRIMNILLKDLLPGERRVLKGAEKRTFLEQLDLKT